MRPMPREPPVMRAVREAREKRSVMKCLLAARLTWVTCGSPLWQLDPPFSIAAARDAQTASGPSFARRRCPIRGSAQRADLLALRGLAARRRFDKLQELRTLPEEGSSGLDLSHCKELSMTIIVAFAPRPEGRAALEKGIEIARRRNE